MLLLAFLATPVFAQFGGMGGAGMGSGGYGGPSILSRGGNGPGRRGGSLVSFNFHAGISGLYTYGITAPRVDASSQLITQNLYGGQAEAGVYGGHEFRRASVGVEYRGMFRRYNNNRLLNGWEQAATVTYSQQLGRDTMIQVTQMGGIFNTPVGGVFLQPPNSADFIGIPANNIFGNRTLFSQSAVMMSRTLGRKWVVSATGSAFYVRREAAFLIGADGYTAQGGIERRIGRFDSVGGFYTWAQFRFPRQFGSSDMHGAYANWSRQISRRLMLTVAGGAFRVETLGRETVALPPEVAAILGRPTGVAAIYRINYAPQGTVSLGYSRQKVSANLSYFRGVTPGNGLYLTSAQQGASAGISYAGTRRFSYGANAGYTQMNSIFTTVAAFRSYNVGAGCSALLAPNLSFVSQVDFRRFSAGVLSNQPGFFVSAGLSYTSNGLPISIW